ncbi:MAG: ATP-binding protein [bacterium]
MPSPTRPFLGRERELDTLARALHECAAGSGSVWLVSGEPGIGKSRLAEELARSAQAAGMVSLDGRCWEAGGAPAFWPWLQALRGLVRQLGQAAVDAALGARAVHLLPLLPELAAARPALGSTPALDADQARFQVLEAVTTLLVEASARGAPILVVLEDLHAADPSSLLLLEFLAREVGRARLVVLGTYRESSSTPRRRSRSRAWHGSRTRCG